MNERMKRRAEYRTWKKGYYHLCTDGGRGILCHDDKEFVHAVNVISVLDQKFPVKVHAYKVMRSHVHLLLSGLGTHCVDAFDYLKYRLSRKLRQDGHPPLPKDYDFKLVPIEDEEQMRRNIVISRGTCLKCRMLCRGDPFGDRQESFIPKCPV